jgi:hypothetical protein
MVHGPATLRSRAVKTRIVERITIALSDVFLPLHGARPSFIVALWRSPRFCGRCLRGSLVPAVAWHKSPEEYKAWSQNLGHENVLTTFSSYGDVARHRQAEIIRALGTA